MRSVSSKAPPSVAAACMVIAVVVAGLTCAVVVIYEPDRHQLGIEFVRVFLQIIAVLVLGQLIAALVREHDRRASRIEALAEYQKDVLAQITSAFVQVKRYRRLLRARAIAPEFKPAELNDTIVRRKEYDEYMSAINEIELQLEAIGHHLEAVPENPESSEKAVSHVHAMKDYLREVLHQYEIMLPRFSDTDATLPLSAFQASEDPGTLVDLIGPAKKSLFRDRFVIEFRHAARLLRLALLKS